jgi:hypothetical protein
MNNAPIPKNIPKYNMGFESKSTFNQIIYILPGYQMHPQNNFYCYQAELFGSLVVFSINDKIDFSGVG